MQIINKNNVVSRNKQPPPPPNIINEEEEKKAAQSDVCVQRWSSFSEGFTWDGQNPDQDAPQRLHSSSLVEQEVVKMTVVLLEYLCRCGIQERQFQTDAVDEPDHEAMEKNDGHEEERSRVCVR